MPADSPTVQLTNALNARPGIATMLEAADLDAILDDLPEPISIALIRAVTAEVKLQVAILARLRYEADRAGVTDAL